MDVRYLSRIFTKTIVIGLFSISIFLFGGVRGVGAACAPGPYCYSCAEVTLNPYAWCKAWDMRFVAHYYQCDGRGGVKSSGDFPFRYRCIGHGYVEGVERCQQEPTSLPPKGYNTYEVAANVCTHKEPGTWEKHHLCTENCRQKEEQMMCPGKRDPCRYKCLKTQCFNPDTGYIWGTCSNKDDCCTSWYTCKYKPGGYPGQDSGNFIPYGKAEVCCYTGSGGGGGGGGGCIPQCSEPLCTVEDHCKEANQSSDPTEYMFYRKTEQGGPLCKGRDTFCTQDNGCGGMQICNTASCYKPETNTSTPPTPTSIRIYEDIGVGDFEWTTYQTLSTNSAQPTLIRYPYSNSVMRTEINDPGLPSGARDIKATLKIGGVQVGNPRLRSVDNPFNIFDIYPSREWLTPGYYAQYSSYFETQNKCDNAWKKSADRDTYFKVNTPPVLSSLTITGSDNQYNGCTAERYTGNNANRTLTFRIAAKDIDTHHAGSQDDANHRMNAAVLWLIKDGKDITNETNQITAVGSGATTTDPEKIGIIVNTGGGIYKSNNSNGILESWGRDVPSGSNIQQPDIYIEDNGERKVLATISTVTERHASGPNDETIIKIIINFKENSPISGKYNIWAGMLDNLTLFPTKPYGYFADIRSVKSTGEIWNFDFVNPTLRDISLEPTSQSEQRKLILSWTSQDNLTNGIRDNHTVINVYKTGESVSTIRRESPLPSDSFVPLLEVPVSEDIGYLQPLTSGWVHPSSSSTQMTANIMENAEGNLHFFITVYDRACNYAKTGESGTPTPPPIALDKWIVTKGGIFYSQGTVNYPTKSLDEYFNLGTELISSSSNSIESVLYYSTQPHMNPAVAKNIIDINNNVRLFDVLKGNFERIRDKLGTPSYEDIWGPPYGYELRCNHPLGCVWEATNIVSRDYLRYFGNIIVVPPEGQKDVYITGNIGSGDDKSSLFIFTEGTVNIGGSASTTPATGLLTDTIDAFILAKKGINILPEAEEGNFHDKIVVNGGLIAFGHEILSGPAFSLKRTLGLYNINAPVLTVNYHPKYAITSELFFGLQTNAYKREVGFKPM